jgi:regulator of protease activity HflC (stomatin/prohibitin superfamily)
MRFLPRETNPLARMIAGVLLLAAIGAAAAGYFFASPVAYGVVAFMLLLIAWLLPLSLMIANQWEKAIVLRLGRLHRIRGAGLFWILPFVDWVAIRIDQRIQTTEFNAEQTLTKDTVPVNVDAIVFWQVHDAERAALEIADYAGAISRVSQTSLREMIGASPLSALLSERKQADEQLKEVIGAKIGEWGVAVISVEIRDVRIPAGLQDAMSRQAQAEREKEARVILGSSEVLVAQKFVDAAILYGSNPIALQLRAMNIIYETTKERGATILMPSTMVDAMNPAAMLGLMAAPGAKPAAAAAG